MVFRISTVSDHKGNKIFIYVSSLTRQPYNFKKTVGSCTESVIVFRRHLTNHLSRDPVPLIGRMALPQTCCESKQQKPIKCIN
jgi:hypothetical protein